MSITVKYIFNCSVCSSKATEEYSYVIGNTVTKPSVPMNWSVFGPYLFCEKHSVDILVDDVPLMEKTND